jgi:flagellar basal body rod protein FlgG
MIQGLHQSAAAATGLEAWSNAIARNIASSNTPGFKGSAVAFEGVAAGFMALGAGSGDSVVQAMIAPEGRSTPSFLPGEVQRSGDPFEFAIHGPGFFRLQRPDGEYVFSRDGQFRIGGDGRLMSKHGFEVTGDAGGIQLLIDGGPITVDPEGRVRQGDQEVGLLAVYDFPRPGDLQRSSGGFVIDPNRPQTEQRVEDARIQQGSLEMSNVSPIREMADLVAVSNALQANQRFIQSMDGLTERAVQLLGNPAG